MGKFQEIIGEDKPVLVDFYATWCAPCKTMFPILDELAKKYSGKLRILKIDVDKNLPAAGKYKIMGVPTLILFKKGEILWRQAGVVPQGELEKILDEAI